MNTQPAALILPESNGTKTTTLEIRLTQGYSALVDPEDFLRFGHLKWTATVQRRKGVVVRVYAYRLERGADGKWHNLFLHRAVMDAKPGQVDHRERGMSTLDCRKTNLRFATSSQNACNSIRAANKHGFIGVDSQTGGSFRGRVSVEGRCYITKTYRHAVLAAIARDELARLHHGPFAVFNFKTPPPPEFTTNFNN